MSASATATKKPVRPAARTSGGDYETRLDWAATHSARIAAMLEAPTVKEVPGRIWRTRLFADGDYLVATLVQNIAPMPAQPGQMHPKVVCYVNRPYSRASGGGSVVQQALFGEYSTDEIVAFLRLDTVDPDTLTWTDETKYSNIVVVSDVIGNLRKVH